MHSRRFACLLLGMWLAGGFLVTWLVNENSRAADRLLQESDPAATLRIKVLGPAETLMLLRYETAELTRTELNLWQGAQIVLGVFFLFFLLFGTSESKFSLTLAVVLIVCVAVQRFAIWPEVVSFGRLTDFLPATLGSGYRNRLLVMEGAFFAVEIGKWVVMAVLGVTLISRGRRSSRSGGAWNQFNIVDKADNRHIDR
ncbi:MAG: hypothetical protein P4L56_24680 [Candidatus Sulfopaludibacter sp.]|nr:hypothetical protein [Candidatus Sulfopaludibacter sp.]